MLFHCILTSQGIGGYTSFRCRLSLLLAAWALANPAFDKSAKAPLLLFHCILTSQACGYNKKTRGITMIPLVSFGFAERQGFEPWDPKRINGFRDRPVRPLRHLSKIFYFMSLPLLLPPHRSSKQLILPDRWISCSDIEWQDHPYGDIPCAKIVIICL